MSETASERVFAVIIGSGFGGLAAAIALQRAGFDDLVILEKADAVGGTWRDNHYPGCACDVPSYLYSYSFASDASWTRIYAGHGEIRAYIERCVDRFDLRRYVRTDAAAVSAVLDEATHQWTVRTADGRSWTARVVIAAIGGLSRPSVPSLPGAERFAGPSFHSAAWRHDVDLDGKSVAVIGTGASAIQIVPELAARAGKLSLFQRTPAWVLPRLDRAFSPRERRLLAFGPLRALYRYWLYWRHESRIVAFTVAPWLTKMVEKQARAHIAATIADPALRERLTPRYTIGCKRVLLSDDYYPALARPNVELVTDGIAEVTARGVRTADGREHPVDAIVYATGFAVHDYLGPLAVRGAGGRSLTEVWGRAPEAYLGTTVSGFPNLFTLVGPNTALGHNSIIFMIESQVRYVVDCVTAMRRRGLDAIDVRPAAMRAFNDELQRRLVGTVWQSGCQSWYRDPITGRNSIIWPGATVEFRLRTRRFDPAAYALRPARPAP